MALNGQKNTRADELSGLFDGVDDDTRALVWPTVENVLFLETQMQELAKLPMIQVCPSDPNRQRYTPAAKLYKDFLQQHTNCIKLLSSILNKNAPDEESPLRAWLNERRQQNAGA